MKTKQLTIPMFPLNISLLPGENTKLYIFEERYKEMVEDCIENGASFGIPFIENGKVQDYGCEVKINRVLNTYDNGAMDILVEAKAIFKMIIFTEELHPKMYGAGLIEYLNDIDKITLPKLHEAIANFYLNIQFNKINSKTIKQLTLFGAASALQLSHQEKFKLISSQNPQVHLIQQINLMLRIAETEKALKEKFVLN